VDARDAGAGGIHYHGEVYSSTLPTAARLAVDSIVVHKLRSALTLLGIVIGVASVVVVGAAIDGLGVYAEQSTAKAFGTESYMVAQVAQVGRSTRSERAAKFRRNKRIRQEDLDYLRLTTGDQIEYSGYRLRPDDVKAGLLTYEGANIVGASAALADIRDVGVEAGRFFNEQEERTRQNVAVIGWEPVQRLFAGQSPIGRSIRIRGIDFRVLGTIEKLGSTGGQTMDNQVYIPATAFQKIYGPENSMAVFAKARAGSGLDLESALDHTRVALRTRFRTRPGQEDNFDSLTPDAIRGFVGQILGLISAVVVPVTCISLVVGGIVVMNIMLVSVTERTREIGVRKALGARKSDIMLQFLTEAVMLGAIGGVGGLALGMVSARGLGVVLEVGLPVTWPYVVLAIAVSSITGVLSGWYPAKRAASMDPVEALRQE
jgi:putative ABC transport system permease protein